MSDNKIQIQRLNFARQKIASVWQQPETSNKVMDWELSEAFAKILVEEMYAPHLGCATTQELCDEISARIARDKIANYKTIDSD